MTSPLNALPAREAMVWDMIVRVVAGRQSWLMPLPSGEVMLICAENAEAIYRQVSEFVDAFRHVVEVNKL